MARSAVNKKMRAVTEAQAGRIALAERGMTWCALGGGDLCGQVDNGIDHTPAGNRREHEYPKCNEGG